MKLNIFICCVFFGVCLGNEPQVYEKVDDQIPLESNIRVVRQPFVQLRSRVYRPPVFQYQEMLQQDPRKDRYVQQQKVDIMNILRNQMVKKLDAPLRVTLPEDRKITDSKISSSTNQQIYNIPEDTTNVTDYSKVFETTKKPVTSRKMNSNSYYKDEGQKIKRQDTNQVVYVNPELVNTRRSEYDLNALNSLVGQDPNSQLEGLQRLLQTHQASHSDIVLAPIKSSEPPPITEEVEDVPNPNTHPNVDTSISIQNLQNQLDEAAKVQVAQALAEAQKEAQAHVEAQHRAIAQAQIDAQKKALAQIALHNQGIQAEALPQPLALVSEVKPEEVQQRVTVVLKPQVPAEAYAPSHVHQQRQPAQVSEALAQAQKEAQAHVEVQHRAIAEAQIEAQNKALAQQRQPAKAQVSQALVQAQKEAQAHVEAQHRAIAQAQIEAQNKALAQIELHNRRIKAGRLSQPLAVVSEVKPEEVQQPLAVVLEQQVPAEAYPSSRVHQQRQQQYGELKAPRKVNLKRISITKTHSVTQGQSPNAYQEVLLETQQNPNAVHQGVNQLKYDDNVDEHQYAARYAFGYKIRDVKMGNEFGHEEKRDGENARGFYHVLLPDGRMQKVEYYADPSGYHAKVTYENLAHH